VSLDELFAPRRWAAEIDQKRRIVLERADRTEDHKGSRRAGKKVMFHRYVVFLDGVAIGEISQAREHCYKMAGRLSYGSTYPLRWIAGDSYRLYYATRKDAVLALLEDHYRKDIR